MAKYIIVSEIDYLNLPPFPFPWSETVESETTRNTIFPLQLQGSDDNDSLVGGSSNDSLSGGGGDDSLVGGRGNDFLSGGRGNDSLSGDSGNDSLTGDNGNDFLSGGNSNDSLVGGNDNDYLFGGNGYDSLDGGSGDDFLDGAYSSNSSYPYDQFVSPQIDTLTGGEGQDTFALGLATDYRNNTASSFPGNLNSQAYYDSFGNSDYALITDFNADQDTIQLVGSPDDYILGASPFGSPNGMGIFLEQPFGQPDELIAIVRTTSDLSLDGGYFTFIQ
ncbi:calcium-binding protein [Lyngbya aestuarii]|uniref:calcium-binding protein n=1 Tax=Lyngbya aestuarii TaxID=118322 RepID=UPI00403D761D